MGAHFCPGACLGLVSRVWFVFVLACFVGLTGPAVLITGAICAAPLGLLTQPAFLDQFREDLAGLSGNARRLLLQPDVKSVGYVLFYLVAGGTLYQVFNRAMI